jgi:hypothetical protein
MPRIFHLVNGIDTFPGCSENWNGRGVTWLHTNTEARAEKIEYFCGPIDRAFGQKDRAEKLYRTMSFYKEGWENVLVGHSNGADVIVDMFENFNGWPNVSQLHLVCAACDADFESNHLNAWLRSGRVGRVSVYTGNRDWALRLAGNPLGRFLGYGALGLHGPLKVAPDVAERVTWVIWPDYGHSDCWHDANFDKTMGLLSA